LAVRVTVEVRVRVRVRVTSKAALMVVWAPIDKFPH